MEGLVNWILMAALCCFAAANIDIYVKEKKDPNSDNILAWMNLAAAIISIISALKFTFT